MVKSLECVLHISKVSYVSLSELQACDKENLLSLVTMPVQDCVEWALQRVDTLQLRELYGQIKGGLPPSLAQLCLFCFALVSLESLEALGFDGFCPAFTTPLPPCTSPRDIAQTL